MTWKVTARSPWCLWSTSTASVTSLAYYSNVTAPSPWSHIPSTAFVNSLEQLVQSPDCLRLSSLTQSAQSKIAPFLAPPAPLFSTVSGYRKFYERPLRSYFSESCSISHCPFAHIAQIPMSYFCSSSADSISFSLQQEFEAIASSWIPSCSYFHWIYRTHWSPMTYLHTFLAQYLLALKEQHQHLSRVHCNMLERLFKLSVPFCKIQYWNLPFIVRTQFFIHLNTPKQLQQLFYFSEYFNLIMLKTQQAHKTLLPNVMIKLI